MEEEAKPTTTTFSEKLHGQLCSMYPLPKKEKTEEKKLLLLLCEVLLLLLQPFRGTLWRRAINESFVRAVDSLIPSMDHFTCCFAEKHCSSESDEWTNEWIHECSQSLPLGALGEPTAAKQTKKQQKYIRLSACLRACVCVCVCDKENEQGNDNNNKQSATTKKPKYRYPRFFVL